MCLHCGCSGHDLAPDHHHHGAEHETALRTVRVEEELLARNDRLGLSRGRVGVGVAAAGSVVHSALPRRSTRPGNTKRVDKENPPL